MKKPPKDLKGLRHGYTTGSNATAAAKAALLSLAYQEKVMEVEIILPNKDLVTFYMKHVEVHHDFAKASIIKDAGDDPDATHLAEIVAEVRWSDEIIIDGGKGVGRATKSGMPIAVGEAAINPVPRKMLREVAEEVLHETRHTGAEIIISVPKGEEIAKKTMNARLGIIGGISILGTRGTVVPFSTAAYRASIAQGVSVAAENGVDHLVLSTGGRSEKFAISIFPELDEGAFVEMGDFVGFSLKQCKSKKRKRVSLVGMIGKFSKVAQGIMMVHSRSAPVDFRFLRELAAKAGADQALQEKVETANTATEAGNIMREAGHDAFFALLCERAAKNCYDHAGGGIEVEVILITLKKELLSRVVYCGPGSEKEGGQS
ncbi:cobalt-precorrin-5B (C(1))-methyltransferase [Bacillus piscicola]|uniref:cobalt-precorrin-5B (C(1))-methyltransferase n=1 Tax=Bacillus piscicola TaxID=1632684 RepID=UPI001F09745A|nr:cobalt-precorrin-5B (C(1))-methyltransferase [Bacillus piscicola]